MSLTTLSLAKEFCRVDTDDLDVSIQALIDGAESWFEKKFNIGLTEEAISEHVNGGGFRLHVSRNPIIAITSITDEETGLDLTATTYEIRDNSVIVTIPEARWDKGIRRWLIAYYGGYAGGGGDLYDEALEIPVPADIKTALLQLIDRGFENRGGKASEGAAGWSVTWSDFWTSDLAVLCGVRKKVLL